MLVIVCAGIGSRSRWYDMLTVSLLHHSFADPVAFSWLARSLCRLIELTANVSENYRLFYATLWQLVLCSARDRIERAATVLVRVLCLWWQSHLCCECKWKCVAIAPLSLLVKPIQESTASAHTHTPSIQWAHGPRRSQWTQPNVHTTWSFNQLTARGKQLRRTRFNVAFDSQTRSNTTQFVSFENLFRIG